MMTLQTICPSPSLTERLATIDPFYWLLVVLSVITYALSQSLRRFYIDSKDPNSPTTNTDYLCILKYFISAPIMISNITTLCTSILVVLLVTMNLTPPGTYSNMAAAAIVGLVMSGNAVMIQWLTATKKATELITENKSKKNGELDK